MSENYDLDAMVKSKQMIAKEKDNMPYFYSLPEHQRYFLEELVLNGRELVTAYKESHCELDGFDNNPKTMSRRALRLFNTPAVNHAYEELSIVKMKLLVSKMGGYVVDSFEGIVDMTNFTHDEKLAFEGRKYIIDKFTKTSEQLMKSAKAEGVNINVAQGGQVTMINVVSSTKEEEQKVFDGQTVDAVFEDIVGNEVEELVVIDEKKED